MAKPKFPHVSAVIFDWDDTLSETGVLWVEAHREKLREHGIELETGAILSFFGNINFAEDIGLEKFIVDGEQQTSSEVFNDVTEKAKEKIKLLRVRAHIVELLKDLKSRGIRLAVVSSSPRELLRESIHDNGLEGVFDIVISVEDVRFAKPNPEGILKALTSIHVPPEDAVMIGDSSSDVLAGEAAGTYTIRLMTELHQHDPKVNYMQGNPDFIARNITEAVHNI
ncbi:HAD-IA family hydrolase [Candidatus Saccharibacteria bacterium]|nr:HAD-IA family hydrolase [Candidatus Saccharibacteria bacterium]